MTDSHIFRPTYDFAAFRVAAARFVRLLVRTRWAADPGFLTPAELARWELCDIAADKYPPAALMNMAADALGHLNHEYIPLCGSGGVRETDPATAVGRLIWNLSGLVLPEGGKPWHNQVLAEAAERLRAGGRVDWPAIADWTLLMPIREDLDRLPRSGDDKDDGPDGGRAQNILRRLDGGWLVQYLGRRPFVHPDSTGVVYLHHLLRHQGRAVPVADLAAAWDHRHRHLVRAVRPEGGVHRSLHDGARLDAAGKAACRDEYERIVQELDRAERNQDTARVAELKAERQLLAGTVARAVRPGGKDVTVADQHRRVVGRVTRAIRREIEKLAEKNPELGTHLNGFVSTGSICVYRPEQPVPWEV